jgi:hypothetical protein
VLIPNVTTALPLDARQQPLPSLEVLTGLYSGEGLFGLRSVKLIVIIIRTRIFLYSSYFKFFDYFYVFIFAVSYLICCDHLGDPGVYRRTILKRIFKKWDRRMGWIKLAQDRNRWRALVNVVMNLRVP